MMISLVCAVVKVMSYILTFSVLRKVYYVLETSGCAVIKVMSYILTFSVLRKVYYVLETSYIVFVKLLY